MEGYKKKGSSCELPFDRDDRICLTGRLHSIAVPLQIQVVKVRFTFLLDNLCFAYPNIIYAKS